MYGFFPYRMRLGETVLHSALATPLCRLQTAQGVWWVFYGDQEPQFRWEGKAQDGILHLSRRDALNAWKTGPFDPDAQEYLILSENFVWEEDGRIRIVCGPETVIRSFPALPEERIPGFVKDGGDGCFAVYKRNVTEDPARVEAEQIFHDSHKSVYEIRITYAESLRDACTDRSLSNSRDTLLRLSYAGERMALYLGTKKINDHFYTGQDVPISLRYFDFPEKLRLELEPLNENAPVYLEKWPRFEKGPACRLEKVTVQELYW